MLAKRGPDLIWRFTLLEVAIGALAGLLWSKLVLVRALSVAPLRTRWRLLLFSGTFALMAFCVWLAVSDTGDALLHWASRKIPHTGIEGAVYVALNVAIIDQFVSALLRATNKGHDRT